jgi:hypothetical protein
VADPWGSTLLGVHVVGEPPLTRKTGFKRTDEFPELITVGSLTPSIPLGIARGMFGSIYAAEASIIEIFNEESVLVSTHHLSLDDDSIDFGDARYPLQMLVRREHLYIAIGKVLLALPHRTQKQRLIEFDQPICHMAASAEHTRLRVVLGLDEGACMIWDPATGGKRVPFATDMRAPHVGINRGGYVIAASERRVEVYDSKEGQLKFVADSNNLPASPIAVLYGSRTDQFAIMTSGGDVIVFEV